MGFGLSRELAEKNAAKYSAEDEVIDKLIRIRGEGRYIF